MGLIGGRGRSPGRAAELGEGVGCRRRWDALRPCRVIARWSPMVVFWQQTHPVRIRPCLRMGLRHNRHASCLAGARPSHLQDDSGAGCYSPRSTTVQPELRRRRAAKTGCRERAGGEGRQPAVADPSGTLEHSCLRGRFVQKGTLRRIGTSSTDVGIAGKVPDGCPSIAASIEQRRMILAQRRPCYMRVGGRR